jgi:hypothetical protein
MIKYTDKQRHVMQVRLLNAGWAARVVTRMSDEVLKYAVAAENDNAIYKAKQERLNAYVKAAL